MRTQNRLSKWVIPFVLIMLVQGVRAHAEEERSMKEALSNLNTLLHSDAMGKNELDALRQVDAQIEKMKKANQLVFTNVMLVPDWDLEGDGLALLAANNYHPSVRLQDLNGDDKVDVIIVAHESGRVVSPYYFLIYLQEGNSLKPALQYQTTIANDLAQAESSYRVSRDESLTTFITWKSEIQKSDQRKIKTVEVKLPLRNKSGCMQPAIPLGVEIRYSFVLKADRGNQDALLFAPENDDIHFGVIGKWFYPTQKTKSAKSKWPVGTWTGTGSPPDNPTRYWWDYTLSVNPDNTAVFTEMEHYQAYDNNLKPVGEEESYLRLRMTGTWLIKGNKGVFTLKREK